MVAHCNDKRLRLHAFLVTIMSAFVKNARLRTVLHLEKNMTKDNIEELLTSLKFICNGNVYTKNYQNSNVSLKVDVSGDGHIYYRESGITVGRETTCNLLEPENLVVLHCVDRLLWKGYSPNHIELEPAWKLGHQAKGGYADIWIRTFKDGAFTGFDTDKESLLQDLGTRI